MKYVENYYKVIKLQKNSVQSNLCTTTPLRTQILWPVVTGGRYSEVMFKSSKLDHQMVAVIGRGR